MGVQLLVLMVHLEVLEHQVHLEQVVVAEQAERQVQLEHLEQAEHQVQLEQAEQVHYL